MKHFDQVIMTDNCEDYRLRQLLFKKINSIINWTYLLEKFKINLTSLILEFTVSQVVILYDYYQLFTLLSSVKQIFKYLFN